MFEYAYKYMHMNWLHLVWPREVEVKGQLFSFLHIVGRGTASQTKLELVLSKLDNFFQKNNWARW